MPHLLLRALLLTFTCAATFATSSSAQLTGTPASYTAYGNLRLSNARTAHLMTTQHLNRVLSRIELKGRTSNPLSGRWGGNLASAMRSPFGSGSLTNPLQASQLWGEAIAGWYEQSSNDPNGWESELFGGIVGFDWKSRNTVTTFSLGYAQEKLDFTQLHTEGESSYIVANLDSTWSSRGHFIILGGGYVGAENALTRNLSEPNLLANGSGMTNGATYFLRIGQQMKPIGKWTMSSSMGIRGLHLHLDPLQETSGGSAAVGVEKQSINSFQFITGIRSSLPLPGPFTLQAYGDWVYEFRDQSGDVTLYPVGNTAGTTAITPFSLDENSIRYGVELTLMRTRGKIVGRYESIISGDVQLYVGSVGFLVNY